MVNHGLTIDHYHVNDVDRSFQYEIDLNSISDSIR